MAVVVQFNLPPEFLDPVEVARAQAENDAARGKTYLALGMPLETVMIVDSR